MRFRFMGILLALALLVACGTPTESTGSGAAGEEVSAAVATAAPEAAAGETATAADAAAGAGDGGARKQYSEPPAMVIDENKQYTATINTTKGAMKAELYANETPMTVNNFVVLARDGFYKDVRFHRIIKDFMVQTGDPEGTGAGGPGYRFDDEEVQRDYTKGTLAMANSGPDTNGSQFFIVHADYPLPKDYTIFGKVTEGLDVLDAIANVPVAADARGEQSVPQEEVLITDITIEEQ